MSELTDRLRGNYARPVDDGAGLLDGKTPMLSSSLISHEAADIIDELESQNAALIRALKKVSAYISLCHKAVCCPTRNPEIDCTTDLNNPDICVECVAASYIAIAEAELESERNDDNTN